MITYSQEQAEKCVKEYMKEKNLSLDEFSIYPLSYSFIGENMNGGYSGLLPIVSYLDLFMSLKLFPNG